MSGIEAPAKWDREIYPGTDHTWMLRQVKDDGTPVIPSSAKCQVKGSFDGEIWVEAQIEINIVDGWITISIPKENTQSNVWKTRFTAVWDILVTVDEDVKRWAMGNVAIIQGVTDE